MSKRFTFNKENVNRATKVAAWSIAATVVSYGIALVASADLDTPYMFLVPIANTLLYAGKDFITVQQGK